MIGLNEDMWCIVVRFGLTFPLVLVLSILAYNQYVAVKWYRHFKFAFHQYAFWLPLLPFVGTTYVALFTGTKVNMLSTLLWAERYFGMPVNFWYGTKYHYVTNNPEEARIILNHPKCYDKAQMYDALHFIFRSSLLLVPGEQWKPRRHYMRTAFKFHLVKSFFSSFYHESCLLNGKIKSMAPNEDLYKYFNRYVFRNFFLLASGLDGDHIHSGIEKFGSLVDSVQDEFVKLLANPSIPAFVWMRIPPGAKLRSLLKEMKKLLKELLLNRKKQLAEVSEYVENPSNMVLIDLLLSEGYKAESESSVFEEFTLFAGAATDTTGHTLVFCFTLLGMYPEIQKLVYEEVISVVGDGNIEHRHIQELKYTEAVIAETLRIVPTVPLYGRKCGEDIDLGTKVVPKGANVMISAHHLHRNPLYWPEPLKFDPSRFSPENASKIIPGTYVPFSIGPRNCIGQGMAMMLLKLTVANMIKEFRITSSHKSVKEFKLVSCISMKTLNALDCNFIPRTKNQN